MRFGSSILFTATLVSAFVMGFLNCAPECRSTFVGLMFLGIFLCVVFVAMSSPIVDGRIQIDKNPVFQMFQPLFSLVGRGLLGAIVMTIVMLVIAIPSIVVVMWFVM